MICVSHEGPLLYRRLKACSLRMALPRIVRGCMRQEIWVMWLGQIGHAHIRASERYPVQPVTTQGLDHVNLLLFSINEPDIR
jgi:hypothetical protein